MAIKDILVCLDPSEAGTIRLALAVHLARLHEAHVTAAYAVSRGEAASVPRLGGGAEASLPDFATSVAEGGLVPGAAVSPPPAEAASTVRPADVVEQSFREALHPLGLAGGWHLLDAGETAELVELALAADLTVIGQHEGGAEPGFRPEDILLASGRPLLVVPYAGMIETVGERVLVAWDGTREAARAVHDALPLLAPGASVTVLTVGPDEAAIDRRRRSLARIVRHLERHGLAARSEEGIDAEVPVADILLSRAADLGIDLIVAGAYHHSRLREALLGGVSRDLLDHMTVPVLMVH
jgi:nucleotide-binding universal stress UspA family protein